MAGAALMAAFAVTGCATQKYVDTHVAAVDHKLADAQGQADALKIRLADHDQRMAGLDRTSREALERAEAAGKLAEGKFLYAVTLQDDGFRFRLNKYMLSDGDETKLKALADQLKADNKNVYLEIQGHTDATGKPDYNMMLGEERAEAVRLFLNQQGVALNRMDTISYGETAPVADNKTKAGRAQNRRVQIVVLA
jgi:outer membrane protein OmpA-like peptidoglycan-associated protein